MNIPRAAWRTCVAALVLLLVAPTLAASQLRTEVRASALHESYGFGSGLGIERMTESSLAVTAVTRFGPRASLTAATGLFNLSTEAEDGGRTTLRGPLDTELRLAVEAVPDRVTVFATADIPTGIASLGREDRSALPLLASEAIGFASPNVLTGGGAGGGFAVAIPAGDLAIGAALSARTSFAYQPFEESGQELHPGREVRLRAGVEGPVARRTFLRLSGVLAARGGAEMDGVPTGVGNLYSGYLSLQQGIGSSALTLYAINVYRSSGGVEQSPLGPGYVPRGNVLAAGSHWTFPVSRRTSVTPRVEVRDSRASGLEESGPLRGVGRTVRGGFDVRHRLTRLWSGVLQAEALGGSLTPAEADVSVSGYRLAAHIQMAP